MYKNSQNPYGDGDTPEVDYEPYRNGSEVITPVDPLPESTRERRDGPGGGKGQILRSTSNTAPLTCGACNTQPEGLLTTA